MLAVCLLAWVEAHQPLWNDGSATRESAFVVEEVEISKAIFGELESGELAYVRMDVPDGFLLDVGLFVGQGCREDFLPELWIASPDLERDGADFALPEGYGAERVSGAWEAYRGHGLQGQKGPHIRKAVSQGSHYLIVVAPEATGYYLLSLGGREVAGGTAEGRAAMPRFNACK